MPIEKRPVQGLYDENQLRRDRETLNKVLDHQFDDSRRQTTAEKLAGITPVNKAYPPGDVRRYGADESGEVDSTDAVRNALLANVRIFFTPGIYTISSTIIIAGSTVVITGEQGGTQSAIASRINFTGTGSLFNATGTEFGGIYIGHLSISGGSADGVPCIVSTRPQSVFERIHMEGSAGYNNPGIRLSRSSQGSWGTIIRSCKWVGPLSGANQQNAYTGFEVSQDGGFCELDEVVAIAGNIGINIIQGEVIRLSRVNCNRQSATYSSELAANGQCGIRISENISGANNYKKAISIASSYIEASTNGVYIVSCESLSIRDSYFDDLGEGGYAVYLQTGDAQNVSIENNNILHRANGGTAIFNNSSNNVRIFNNYINCSGTGTPNWLNTNVQVEYGNNTIIAGALSDPNGLAEDMKPAKGSWTPAVAGATTAGTQTYSLQAGRYWKVGRLVHFDFTIIMSALDGATAGNVLITGLPYTSRDQAAIGRMYNAHFGAFGNLNLTAGYTFAGATIGNNATSMTLFESGDNVALQVIAAAALTATTTLYGSGSYET